MRWRIMMRRSLPRVVPDRLDVSPLARALLIGLRERRNIGTEPEDRLTKLYLFGLPIAVFIVSLIAGLRLTASEELIAAGALFIGANLTAFAQLASWRERLTLRQRKVDGAKLRMLDEAVAHVLSSVLVTMLATFAQLVTSSTNNAVAQSLASAVVASALTYLGLTVVVVTNLLWDAYRGANPIANVVERPDDDTRARDAS